MNENIVELSRTFNKKFPIYNYIFNKIAIWDQKKLEASFKVYVTFARTCYPEIAINNSISSRHRRNCPAV